MRNKRKRKSKANHAISDVQGHSQTMYDILDTAIKQIAKQLLKEIKNDNRVRRKYD